MAEKIEWTISDGAAGHRAIFAPTGGGMRFSEESSALTKGLFHLHREVIPASVTVALDIHEAEEVVTVILTNTGHEPAAACRFALLPPDGRAFNPSYVGVTGTAPYEWDDLPAAKGTWRIQVQDLRPGETANLDFALSPAMGAS